MDLKEFDLDLPYLVNEAKIQSIMKDRGCSYQEATKFDYEQNWKELRRSFRLETRCMTSMFERLFGKLKTEDCWKILVECVSDIKEERVLNFSGVCTVQVKFGVNDFLESDEYNKKVATLELLIQGIRKVVQKYGWNEDSFNHVYSLIKETQYINEWVWKKPVKSPDGKYVAEVICQHNIKSMDISILVKEKGGSQAIKKNSIISELPDEFAYAKHLGQLQWLSNFEVVLINKKGDHSWSTLVD
ncbi:MAG TPA: hypothetical protein GX497_11690 [Bacillus bacterium]|nr:hypothetical protein [Bacillus sp. (in: firmicutes)]